MLNVGMHRHRIVDIYKNDTLYEGYAAKFNGIYFLSRAINDSSYHIHAMHTDGYTIKGLHTEPLQIKLIHNAAQRELKELVVNKTEDRILLQPKREILYEYFKHLLTKLRGDTILDYDLHMRKNQPNK